MKWGYILTQKLNIKRALLLPVSISLKTKADQGLVYSPWNWKVFPRFREIDPKLLKVTIRVRRSRLLFQSESEVGLYFRLETRDRACAPFTCVNFTEN